MHAKLGSENQNSSCEHEHLQISTILLTFRGSGGKFRKFSVKSLGVSAKHVEKIVAGFRSAVFFQPNFFFQGQTCPPPTARHRWQGGPHTNSFFEIKQNKTKQMRISSSQHKCKSLGGGAWTLPHLNWTAGTKREHGFQQMRPKNPKDFSPKSTLFWTTFDHFQKILGQAQR